MHLLVLDIWSLQPAALEFEIHPTQTVMSTLSVQETYYPHVS